MSLLPYCKVAMVEPMKLISGTNHLLIWGGRAAFSC